MDVLALSAPKAPPNSRNLLTPCQPPNSQRVPLPNGQNPHILQAMATASEPPTTWIPANTFASRLIQVRQARDLSQLDAAKRCGLDDGSWSNWEHGTKPRDMARVVRQICDGLGVDRDWLAFGDIPKHTRAHLTEDGKEAPIILGMSHGIRELQTA